MTVFQFDPWCFDPDTRQLSSDDVSLELKPKGAEVLAYLLVNRNRVVTREELLSHVWADVIVAEGSLTKTVTELRGALNDNARDPIFIKTVLKKGYFWVHPHTRVVIPEPSASGAPRKEAIAPGQGSPLIEASTEEGVSDAQPAADRAAGVSLRVFATAILVVLVAVAGLFLSREEPEKEPVKAFLPKMAVLPIANQTGDPEKAWLEVGLRDIICRELNRFGAYDLVSLSDLEQVGAAPGDADARERLMTHINPTYVVEATISQDEQGYRLDLVIRGRESVGEHVVAGENLTLLGHHASHAIAAKTGLKLEAPQDTGTQNEFADQSYAKGMFFFEAREYEKAINHFVVCLDNQPDMAWARFQMARARYNLGDYEKAEAMFVAVTEQAQLMNIPILEAESLRYQGLIQRKITRWPEAIAHTRRARDIYRNLDHLSGLVLSQNQLATIHAQKGELVEAASLLRASMEMVPTLGNRFVSSQTLIKQGSVLSMQGQISEAESVFLQALDEVRLLQDKRNEAAVLNNLGNIAQLRGDASAGSDFYQQALAIFEGLDNRAGQARTHLNLAEIAAEERRFEVADDHLRKALPLARDTGNRYLECMALNSLGANALRDGRDSEAGTWLNLGRALAGELGTVALESDAICYQTLLFLRGQHFERAEESLARLADRASDQPLFQATRAWLHYGRGRFQEAFLAQERARSLSGDRWREVDEKMLSHYRKCAAEGRPMPAPEPDYLPGL